MKNAIEELKKNKVVFAAVSNALLELNTYRQSIEEKADGIFIKRGFCSLAYHTDFLERLFGKGVLRSDLEFKTENGSKLNSENAFRKFVDELSIIEGKGESVPDEYLNRIFTSRGLSSSSKLDLMRRWFPVQYSDLIDKENQNLSAARRREIEGICRLYLPPCEDLAEKLLLPKRKEICNSVLSDALAEFGFFGKRKSGGLLIFAKKMSNDLALTISPDVKTLSTPGVPAYSVDKSGTLYRPENFKMLPIELNVHLAIGDGSPKNRVMQFSLRGSSLANAICGRKYSNSCDLEVALRALVLWYELMVHPFEEYFSKSLNG
jgi:hypothetical protein